MANNDPYRSPARAPRTPRKGGVSGKAVVLVMVGCVILFILAAFGRW